MVRDEKVHRREDFRQRILEALESLALDIFEFFQFQKRLAERATR